MSELDQDSAEVTEQVDSLEQALQKNWAAASDQSDEPPEADSGDEPSIETEASVRESEEDPLEPLEKWSDEQKEIFNQLDRPAQQFLLDRHRELESDYTKKTTEVAETRKRYERLDKVLSPYTEALDKQGVDITPHLGSALQAYFAYLQNPAETVKYLIQNANLGQDQLFEDESTDPDIRALRTELREARQEIAKLKDQPQDESVAQKELEAFKSATNEDGSPKYPHFERLKSSMAPMVAEGKSLEDAYNEALWMLPEHRKAQLEKERKEAIKADEAKRKEKAEKAKKAGTLPSSDVDQGTGLPEMNGNWEKALKHTLSNLGG